EIRALRGSGALRRCGPPLSPRPSETAGDAGGRPECSTSGRPAEAAAGRAPPAPAAPAAGRGGRGAVSDGVELNEMAPPPGRLHRGRKSTRRPDRVTTRMPSSPSGRQGQGDSEGGERDAAGQLDALADAAAAHE